MIIYKVTNILNGKIYIGQTIKSLSARKSSHRKNSHKVLLNPNSLAYSIKEFGFDNFKFEVVKECFSKNELDLNEKFFIKEFQSNDPSFGFNITSGGSSNYGSNQEYRDYMSKISTCKRCVDVYDICGKFINTYKSINEAGRYLGVNSKSINRVLKRKKRTTNGFIFRYFGEGVNILENYDSRRKISQYDMSGNKISDFESIKEASEKLGFVVGKC